jgi:hypothetical protein
MDEEGEERAMLEGRKDRKNMIPRTQVWFSELLKPKHQKSEHFLLQVKDHLRKCFVWGFAFIGDVRGVVGGARWW